MEDMTLREVCTALGVSRRAVQGYENESLVTATGKNNRGYLLYNSEAQERIKKIKLYQDIANSHFLRTAGPHSPDSPGHIKRTVLEISRAERGLRPANQYRALSQKAMPSQSVR